MLIEQSTVNRRKEELTAKWKGVTKKEDLHVVIMHIYKTHGEDKKNGGITPVRMRKDAPMQKDPRLSGALTRLLDWMKVNPILILSTFPESDSD